MNLGGAGPVFVPVRLVPIGRKIRVLRGWGVDLWLRLWLY
jgi:hypothetical protein